MKNLVALNENNLEQVVGGRVSTTKFLLALSPMYGPLMIAEGIKRNDPKVIIFGVKKTGDSLLDASAGVVAVADIATGIGFGIKKAVSKSKNRKKVR